MSDNTAKGHRMNLQKFDHIVVSSSAGKDSQAMLARIVELATAAGVLKRVAVVHADLGRVEWGGTDQVVGEAFAPISTIELVREHAKHYGLRLEIVRRPQGDLLEQVLGRRMWPGMGTTQFCTSDHKTAQIKTLFTKLTAETLAADPDRAKAAKTDESQRVKILDCVGLRADEGQKRSKKMAGLPRDEHGATFEPNVRATNKTKREVTYYYPVADYNEASVWAAIDEAGTRAHWAYEAGMPRLSCMFCIYAPKSALIIAGKANPDLLAQYVETERVIGHQFSQKLSIASIADAIESDERVELEGWGDQA